MKTARHIECKTLKKEGQWKAVPSEILVKIYIYINIYIYIYIYIYINIYIYIPDCKINLASFV